jgi:MAP/microtubule affinity-regulating kinase
LHKRNINHRDIKLDNIIINPKNLRTKIIDFGFAKFIKKDMKKVNYFCGTPSYMAPELIKKKTSLSLSVDIWAVGVLYYILLLNKYFHCF